MHPPRAGLRCRPARADRPARRPIRSSRPQHREPRAAGRPAQGRAGPRSAHRRLAHGTRPVRVRRPVARGVRHRSEQVRRHSRIGDRVTPLASSHSGLPPRGIDIRLAIGAVAGWLAVIAGLGWAPSRVLATGLLGAGTGVALLVAVRRGVRFAAAAALAAFCVALVLIPLAARSARARDSPLAALARERAAVTATLTVSADPRPLAATGPAGAPRVAVDAALRSITVGGRELSPGGAVLV